MTDSFVEDTSYQRRFGFFELLRKIREDQLSVWVPELFDRNLLRTRLLFLDNYFLNKPAYIEHVLLGNARNYSKSRMARRLLGSLLGNGLVISEGDFWRRQRRIAAPAFHHARIRSFADAMVAVTENRLACWRHQDAGFDVAAEMMGLTLAIIARTMFSTDVASEAARVGHLMHEFVAQKPSLLDLLGLPDWLPRGRKTSYVTAIALFDRMVSRLVAERRSAAADRGDLLSMLLAARDPETGEGMSDREIRDEVVTIFLAGHETTANALSWVWYLLARHPDCAAKLHAELDAVLDGRAPRFEDLEKLSYTRMVFEEAMRLYPPAHTISRMAIAEDRIGGVRIPPGANITISPYVTHRNPTLWEEPERFDPERFTPERVACRPRFAYFPFGGGPRICIGMGFAMIEAQIIIAMVAQRWHLRLLPEPVVAPIGLMTLRAKQGIWVRLEPRASGANGPSAYEAAKPLM